MKYIIVNNIGGVGYRYECNQLITEWQYTKDLIKGYISSFDTQFYYHLKDARNMLYAVNKKIIISHMLNPNNIELKIQNV